MKRKIHWLMAAPNLPLCCKSRKAITTKVASLVSCRRCLRHMFAASKVQHAKA